MCALESHVKQVLSTFDRIVSPTYLVKNLRCISRSFQMWRQEDAHEYMRYLIEALQKCCQSVEVSDAGSLGSQKSLIYEIFGGELRSQVKCTRCSHCSNTFDPFLDLSLEIVRAESLVKALAHFTAVEVLDGDNKYQCSKCKIKVRALKQFTIDKAPQILTVQFKRFSSSGAFGGKIDKRVHFDQTLDMNPFVNSGEAQNEELRYSLYAVLVHSGWSTRSGHYYCFVRTAMDVWHVLDDNRVSQVSEKTVLQQKAYILFYMRDTEARSVSDSNNHGENGNDIADGADVQGDGTLRMKRVSSRDTTPMAHGATDLVGSLKQFHIPNRVKSSDSVWCSLGNDTKMNGNMHFDSYTTAESKCVELVCSTHVKDESESAYSGDDTNAQLADSNSDGHLPNDQRSRIESEQLLEARTLSKGIEVPLSNARTPAQKNTFFEAAGQHALNVFLSLQSFVCGIVFGLHINTPTSENMH